MMAGFEDVSHNVTIHDARISPGTFHETGFTLIKLDKVSTVDYNTAIKAQLKTRYAFTNIIFSWVGTGNKRLEILQ